MTEDDRNIEELQRAEDATEENGNEKNQNYRTIIRHNSFIINIPGAYYKYANIY